LIRTARVVNDEKPEWVIEKVKLAVAEFLRKSSGQTARDVTIACFGLAFKPDIDDLRESPALAIVKTISEFHPGPVLAVEPNISELPKGMSLAFSLISAEKAKAVADVVVLLVDHREFKEMELVEFRSKKVIDTRGTFQR